MTKIAVELVPRDLTVFEDELKTIKADKHIEDLNQWLSFLESMGYANTDCMILNSLDFGVPQDRERAFIISCICSSMKR